MKRSSEFFIKICKISPIPNDLAYSRSDYTENKEYNVPFTNVLTYIFSCSNKSFSTPKTYSRGSSHFLFPLYLIDKFMNKAVAYS